MRTSRTSAYQEMMINSKFLEVPRGSYQRELNIHRVRKITSTGCARSQQRLTPGCSTRPRSATAAAATMCLMASIPSRSSSCSMAARI